MAQRGAGAGIEESRRQSTVDVERSVSDGVDARVNPVQSSLRRPSRDARTADSQRLELAPADDAKLPLGKVR